MLNRELPRRRPWVALLALALVAPAWAQEEALEEGEVQEPPPQEPCTTFSASNSKSA